MKKIMNTATTIALLALVLLLAWTLAGSTHATQTAARAAQQSSLAVTVLTIMLALVFVVGFSVIIWLLVKLRRVEARTENYLSRARHASPSAPGQWAAGPNARWGRTDTPPLGTGNAMQQSIQQLVSLQMLQLLRGLGGEQQSQVRDTQEHAEFLPANYFGEDDGEEYWYD